EWKKPRHKEPDFKEPESCLNDLKNLLGSLNICSKEYIVRPYDHEVKGATVVKPFTGIKNDGPSDASVIAPKIGSYQGLAVGHGICPRYSDIDAYHMSACAFDEMVRNIVATGAKVPDKNNPVMWSVNDNFCCPDSIYDENNNPSGKLKFAKIVRANKALYDYSTLYKIPLTSGKDSMKNDFTYTDENGKKIKISIPLTILYSGVCKIKDIRKCVTIDAKSPGDLVYILGRTKKELGASEYFHQKGFVGNNVPKVDGKTALNLYKAIGNAMDKNLIESCHDCSDGGLGVSLAETAFSGGYGVYVDLSKIPKDNVYRSDYLLFSESQSRFITTVRPENKEKFEETLRGNVFGMIGIIQKDPVFTIKKLDGKTEQINIQKLKTAWQKPLRFDLPLEKVR
ncbi:phosphoribosylformylglycinamidine synthase, partial [Candidatus Woesearchaeota archaeon]|nr:phosphoribosylformylglycinamidine synthase [Candidatus Woesearchaeota archaeon]